LVVMSTFRFFVIESNSFFAFDHENMNVSLFFSKLYRNIEHCCIVFLLRTFLPEKNATFRFEIESKQKVTISFVLILKLNKIFGSRTKISIRLYQKF
jgi:hypothetical protein